MPTVAPRVARVLPAVVAFAATAALLGSPALPDPAADATAAVRAGLPEPVEGAGFEFEGDLEIAGERAGRVRYAAEAGAYREQPVWLATEETVQEFGGSTIRRDLLLYLARDLTLLRGEATWSAGEAWERTTFLRSGDGFEVESEGTTPRGKDVATSGKALAGKDSTYGRVAVLLFARAARSRPGSYSLPWFDPGLVAPSVGSEHEAAAQDEPAAVVLTGDGASFRQGRHLYEARLAPDGRPLSVRGVVPPKHVVPKGTAREPEPPGPVEDGKPAPTWRAALLAFGHGFHLADEAVLSGSVHWPSLWAREVETGGWPKDQPVEELRTAWVAELLRRSKRRPRSETDELMALTLATGTVKRETSDEAVLSTHPEFGGNVFHFRRIDDAWFLVRVDQ